MRALILLAWLGTEAAAATFTVTSTADTAGATCAATCTLRQAITAANATAAADAIVFNIAGAGPHRISLATALPDVTQPVAINGYSQPGSSVNSAPFNSNAVLRIIIDAGALTGFTTVLSLGNGSSARGLAIVGAGNATAVTLDDNSTLAGCFVGLEPDGTLRGMRHGVALEGNGAVLGGATVADRNVIGGHSNAAVFNPVSSTHRIEGNLIGLKADGITPAQNVLGIDGGLASASEIVVNNTISCSTNVNILDYGTLVENNRLGTTADGLGNPGCPTGHEVPRPNSTWRGNTIAFRPTRGILLAQDFMTGVVLQNNRIFSAGHPIDLASDGFTANDPLDADIGPNNRQNHPLITRAERISASQLRLTGSLHSLPNTSFRLHFYAAVDVTRSAGSVVLADAERVTNQVIDVTTDASGNAGFGPAVFNFSGSGTLGAVSATATRLDAGLTPIETSELGAAQLVSTPNVTNFVVTNTNAFGSGSLYNAFWLAHAAPDGTVTDRISFAIPGTGPHTLTASGALGILTSDGRVEIDGSTQSGSTPNSSADAFNATLPIDLLNYRLQLSHPQSVIRGLSLRGTTPLVELAGSTIEGSAVGVNLAGTTLSSNSQSARLIGCAGCRVGGATDAQRNHLGCPLPSAGFPATSCVDATGAALIENNLIGLQRGGVAALSTPANPGALIGTQAVLLDAGAAIVRGNRIGFLHRGIVSFGSSLIEDNDLGVGATGNSAALFFSAIELIGGRARIQGNRIRFSGRSGMLIGNGSTGNALIDNALGGNAQLGIDLNLTSVAHGDGVSANDAGDADSGANGGQNFPQLASAVRNAGVVRANVTLSSLPSTAFRLRYCFIAQADPSGHGECDVPIAGSQDITTDASGQFAGSTVDLPFVAGATGLVATAARVLADGEETSEFSQVAPIAEATATSITVVTPNPSIFGQAIAISVTVAAQGGNAPGSVTITSSGGGQCVAALSANTGNCSLLPGSTGNQTLTASYPASTGFVASSDTRAHTVNRAATTLEIQSDTPDPSTFGEAVTVTFNVASASPAPATGSVTVSDGSAQCTGALGAFGNGSCVMTPGGGGNLTLTASYPGNANFEASSDTESHLVNPVASALAILSHSPDPSVSGQPVNVSAQLTSSVGTPAGPIVVSDGAGAACQIAGASGNCNLIPTNAGTITLRADFATTATHQASTASSLHLVNRAATVLTPATPLASDGGPPRQFAPMRFSVLIAAVAPGAGVPTGSITVTGTPGVEVCVITLPAPSCELVVQTFGDRTFNLSYSGDSRYLPSSAQVVANVRSDALHRSGFEEEQ